MLPTYEDVLGEGVALLSAGRQDVDFEPCIMVEFEQGGYLRILCFGSNRAAQNRDPFTAAMS